MEKKLQEVPLPPCAMTPSYRSFRGCRLSAGANYEYYKSAADYLPEPGDIFIVSYPKCGTTWLQHIVYLLKRNGHPSNNIGEVVRSVPYVAQDGWPPEGTEILALKYHLPLQLMTPLSEKARYIYVSRNPKDACVSYYYFLQNLPGYKFESFGHFFDAFVAGQLPYGDFFDHLADWVSIRHQPNVLLVTYESLHKDRKRVVSDIADFIGVPLDTATLEDVLLYSSFEFMSELARKDNFMENYLKASTNRSRSTADDKKPVADDKKPVMMRRGIVGDWRNHLSPEQSRALDSMLEDRVPDMVDTWKDAMLGNF